MEWSEIGLIFVSVFTTLIPGIVNNPLLRDYAGIFGNQSYGPPMPMHGAQLGAEVEIAIRAENLRDRDLMTKSDPICHTFIRTPGNLQWSQIHTTEKIENDLSPIFALKPVLSCFQAENKTIKFEIYDCGQFKNNFLGFAIINLGTLISSGLMRLPVQKRNLIGLQSNNSKAKIIVTAERLINNSDQVTMTLSGVDLAKKDVASLSDPYMEVFKLGPGNNYVLVHRTEVHKNQQNVTWKQFTVPMKNLCNGDINRLLFFVCWDWNRNAKPTLIGQFRTNLLELRDLRRTTFDLSSKTAGHYAGQIIVKLDYLYGSGQQAFPPPGRMMALQTIPAAFPQPGLSSHYPPAQPLPYNAVAQSSMYGAGAPNVSTLVPATYMMNASAQVPDASYMSTMYPPPFPAPYPPTAAHGYVTSMPVQYVGQSSTPYGHVAGSFVYPGIPPAEDHSTYDVYDSHLYHGRR